MRKLSNVSAENCPEKDAIGMISLTKIVPTALALHTLDLHVPVGLKCRKFVNV